MNISDLETLLAELTHAAHFFLKKSGEFYPFGIVMKTNGDVEHQASWDGDDHPASVDVIARLEQVIRDQATKGEIRAAGICFDVRIRRPNLPLTDALQFHLEHVEGRAMNVFQPYSKGLLGRYKYSELFVEARDARFFQTPAS